MDEQFQKIVKAEQEKLNAILAKKVESQLVGWRAELSDDTQMRSRFQKEVRWAQLYAKDFNHGTPTHMHLVLIAKMADMLDALEPQAAMPS